MKLKKQVFVKAARSIAAKRQCFACTAITGHTRKEIHSQYDLYGKTQKTCEYPESARYQKEFNKIFRPRYAGSGYAYFGVKTKPKNQLARSLALLFAAEILGGKDA